MLKLFFLLFLSVISSSFTKTEVSHNNNPNPKKNLIIVAITNYDWDKVAIFFNSYVKANFENTDFVVYVNNMTQATINKIESCGTIILPFPEQYKKVSIINNRWIIYSDYLKKNINKYNLVFTSDTKDLFFQKDLFKYYENITKPFLGIAIEDGFISQSYTNRQWIINAYGEELYNTIKEERIICVGTVWGTVDKFIEFCDIMWQKLNSEWSISNNVIEQAVGNFLIYHDKMFNDCIIFSENRDGPVMTIGLTNRAFINLDSDNNVLNIKKEVAAVVHQYDRKDDIVQIAINKYYPEFNQLKENKKNIWDIIFIFCIGVIVVTSFLWMIYFYRGKTDKGQQLIYNNNINDINDKNGEFKDKIELI